MMQTGIERYKLLKKYSKKRVETKDPKKETDYKLLEESIKKYRLNLIQKEEKDNSGFYSFT